MSKLDEMVAWLLGGEPSRMKTGNPSMSLAFGVTEGMVRRAKLVARIKMLEKENAELKTLVAKKSARPPRDASAAEPAAKPARVHRLRPKKPAVNQSAFLFND